MHRRLVRLEQAASDRLPFKPWVVFLNPNKYMSGTPEFKAAFQEFIDAHPDAGGAVGIGIVEGRQAHLLYEGERLKPDAWPNHLLVPKDGPRPEGEPIPYCLERVPFFRPTEALSDGRTQ